MTGIVFKIQANMDPNHRDRIAFMRLASGRLTRGMKAKIVRTGKPMTLSAPQFFFAQDRSIADEAFAGDVVGIPNHGLLRIGDALTEGEELSFTGIPSFAPEILRRVKLADPMKAKKLRSALEELAEEGVVQLFLPADGSPAIVGVVGALQLDVLADRLANEYGVPIDFETTRFEVMRWVSSADRKALDTFATANRSAMASDLDGAPVFMAQSQFSLNYALERAPDIAPATSRRLGRRGVVLLALPQAGEERGPLRSNGKGEGSGTIHSLISPKPLARHRALLLPQAGEDESATQLCCFARQDLDRGPVLGGEELFGRHPGAANGDDIGQCEIGRRVAGRDAASRTKADLRQRRGQGGEIGNAARRFGGKEFLQMIALFEQGHRLAGGRCSRQQGDAARLGGIEQARR